MKRAYKNFPLDECARAMRHILKTSPPGTAVFQKWTCGGCGDRVTGSTPNALTEFGRHDECGHVTNIGKTGCNYSVRMAIGGMASIMVDLMIDAENDEHADEVVAVIQAEINQMILDRQSGAQRPDADNSDRRDAEQ